MYNVSYQEAIVTVIPTSRHGLNYDKVKVETTFIMDEPFPEGEVLFVPTEAYIPQELLTLISAQGFTFGPMLSKDVSAQINDFGQEVQDPNRRDETRRDALLGYLMTYMDNVRLTPVAGNLYNFSYTLNLYPNNDGSFDLKTTLPLAGLTPTGNVDIQLVVVLPNNVTVDPGRTQGVDVNGQPVEEHVVNTGSGRNIVTFYYRLDPEFTVNYRYNG